MCCDRKEIECKMDKRFTQFMMPLADDARSQRTGWRPEFYFVCFSHFQKIVLLIVIFLVRCIK